MRVVRVPGEQCASAHVDGPDEGAGEVAGAGVIFQKRRSIAWIVESLRKEQFNFRGSVWRRERDLFRWDENERRLRDKITELEQRLAGVSAEEVPE